MGEEVTKFKALSYYLSKRPEENLIGEDRRGARPDSNLQ
jgi:hypothetical protein